MRVNANGGPVSAQDMAELKERLGLAPRQAEIVNHILRGKADKQIARELGISVPTVRTHLGRLFRKVGVNGRVEPTLHLATALRNQDSGHER